MLSEIGGPIITYIKGCGKCGIFTLKTTTKCHITATCFSNPHTNLGARRSRHLGVITVTN